MPPKSKKTKSSQTGPTLKSAHALPSASHQPRRESPPPIEDEPAVPTPIEPERSGDTTESVDEPAPLPSINRKKQKRREKEAAKRLAEQQAQTINGHGDEFLQENGHVAAVKQGRGPVKGYFTEETDYVDPDFQNQLVEGEEEFYSNDEDIDYDQAYNEGPDHSWLNTSRRKKGSKKRPHTSHISNAGSTAQKPFPTLSNAALRSAHKMSNANDHIWNTSTQAERENIKQFWLELGEDERRSLVRVEKEAVLRKMKEQQKHSCSCSVCGRKRTAIEEELEVLYDAYYQELEQFANHNNDGLDSPTTLAPSRAPLSYRNQPHPMAGAYPTQGRIQELGEDGEELDDEEDEYDDEEEDEDDYSDEYADDLPPGPADFFQFGNSLTVKDGILTVADDLLKNDGKHFIDMMEQLAERRMQREEEIHYPAPPLAHQSLRQGHNHPPIDEDDEYDDEEDDEDYDSQEEDEFEGDEMDSMTEEQRMEEGRRMFQIFAARMFEQRVLTAYKEKVAAERQRKLLEELEAEGDMQAQREAKKMKDAAKKKEKKARQKAVKDEEKAKKDAEKAAQEAAIRDAEEKKLAEKRVKQDEQRRKREAERKAAEDERTRKEAERTARAIKERERQQEAERKAKEAKEKEKKLREEQRKRERDEREAKEAELREQRQKEENERKDKELQQRKERETAGRTEREAKERQKTEQTSRPQAIALPPGLVPPSRNAQLQSPYIPVATPVVPPSMSTPAGRSRQTSQPSQHSSSPRSQKATTETSLNSASPASVPSLQPTAPTHSVKHPRQGPPLHHPQPNAPRSPLNNLGFHGRNGLPPHSYSNMHGIGINGIPTSMPGPMAMNAPVHMYSAPPLANQQRYPPNGLPFPPGFNMQRPFQPSQHMPFHQPPPGIPPMASPHPPNVSQAVHSRQPSGSDNSSQPAPIARPGPIARPTSTTPDRQKGFSGKGDTGVEKITTQLGSSALLDDSDEPFSSQLDHRVPTIPLAPPGTGRLPFASTFGGEKPGAFGTGASNWSAFNNGLPAGPFGQTPRPSQGWSQPVFDPLGAQAGLGRSHVPRPIAVRLLLVQACRQLSNASVGKGDGYHQAQEVLRRVGQLQQPGEPPVSLDEILGICDTEGNVQNGGGTFEVMVDATRGQIIKFIEDSKTNGGIRGSVGDIGGPIAAPGHQASSFGSIGQGVQHQAFRPQPPGPSKW
ncbi:Stress response protein nst1 [Lithohypha guttulata]|uniref:Stress response protein nst1 n=1 Tax=Lithohypha guttulata TaxID=1690604 RepID=UPI002DE03A7F|nr:Stress response protein nst1 [Lithohypha guttulata]KAK5097954.1 Stress response protein nst1 [Lithohypha guttulata]